MCGRRSASAAELVRSEYNSDLITLQRSPDFSRERHGGPRVRKQWTCPATVREVAPVSSPQRLGIGSRVPCHAYRVVSDRHIASILKNELVQEVPLSRPVEQLVLASFGVEESDAASAPKTTSSAARLVSLDHAVESCQPAGRLDCPRHEGALVSPHRLDVEVPDDPRSLGNDDHVARRHVMWIPVVADEPTSVCGGPPRTGRRRTNYQRCQPGVHG